MTVDYGRLLDGVSSTAERVTSGDLHDLAAINELVATALAATRAAGATYTEYGDDGGRVVAAAGQLSWALGRPIEPEYVDPWQPAQPWAGRVDQLPARIAEPLLSRNVVGLAGHPVRSSTRVVGAVHLYFAGVRPGLWEDVGPVLRLVAESIVHLCTHPISLLPGNTPESDDRALFLAMAGHELRTPATVIKGYASTLARHWGSLTEPDRREAAAVLAQRADELALLVDRLLAASVGAPAAGWLVRAIPFDPVETLLRVVGELPAELRRAVRAQLPDSLPLAYGDPAILVSIISELVRNAVRYSVPGAGGSPGLTGEPAHPGASVDLRAGADAKTVFVRVCDQGVGIDPAHVERAFQRFWQAEPSGEAGRGGVGLGLYLVRRLVERQNGWVSLRPRPGGGSIAEVRLPRADDRTPSPAAGMA